MNASPAARISPEGRNHVSSFESGNCHSSYSTSEALNHNTVQTFVHQSLLPEMAIFSGIYLHDLRDDIRQCDEFLCCVIDRNTWEKPARARVCLPP